MWTYEQTTGKLLGLDDNLVGVGYSGGECGLRPEAVNNPEFEPVANVGPLPAGRYYGNYVRLSDPKLGHFAIHLSPDMATREHITALGRDPDSFFMHGDRVDAPGQRAASDGCLIFSYDVRFDFWSSNDRWLDVVAVLPASRTILEST